MNENQKKQLDQLKKRASEKWYRRELSTEETEKFIEDARAKKSPGSAFTGRVSESSKKKIQELTGISPEKIFLNDGSVIHADLKRHNLEKDDLLKRNDVINNPLSIRRSMQENMDSPVVLFRGDDGGIITFKEAVHKNYGGYLSSVTAHRKKKKEAGQGPDAVKRPPGTNAEANAKANVQNVKPSTPDPNIPQKPHIVKRKE
jgi:hypothetical protein